MKQILGLGFIAASAYAAIKKDTVKTKSNPSTASEDKIELMLGELMDALENNGFDIFLDNGEVPVTEFLDTITIDIKVKINERARNVSEGKVSDEPWYMKRIAPIISKYGFYQDSFSPNLKDSTATHFYMKAPYHAGFYFEISKNKNIPETKINPLKNPVAEYANVWSIPDTKARAIAVWLKDLFSDYKILEIKFTDYPDSNDRVKEDERMITLIFELPSGNDAHKLAQDEVRTIKREFLKYKLDDLGIATKFVQFGIRRMVGTPIIIFTMKFTDKRFSSKRK